MLQLVLTIVRLKLTIILKQFLLNCDDLTKNINNEKETKIVFIIRIEANSNGSRPPVQSWSGAAPPDGFAFLTDAQKDAFYSTVPAGFVNITVEEREGIKYIASIEVNQEALDAYRAILPDPTISVKAEKIAEIKQSCEDYICAGTDVTYADNTSEHFTYTLADQSNISEMFTAIMAGATEYPYHADGEICKIYSKAEIVTIYGTLCLFKTEATTYHNSLKAQINAMTDADAISAIKFKETELTGEYLTNYTAMMASAQTQLNAILAKIPTEEA